MPLKITDYNHHKIHHYGSIIVQIYTFEQNVHNDVQVVDLYVYDIMKYYHLFANNKLMMEMYHLVIYHLHLILLVCMLDMYQYLYIL